MIHSPRISLGRIVTLSALALLAGCSSGSSGSPPVTMPTTPSTPSTPTTPTTPPPSASLTTLNALPSGYIVDFPAHAGVESMSAIDGRIDADPGQPSYTTVGKPRTTLQDMVRQAYADPPTHHFSGCAIDACIGSALKFQTAFVSFTEDADTSLRYATYGVWNVNLTLPNFRVGQGVFAGGIPTDITDRPVSGTATYTGRAAGFAAFSGGGGNFAIAGNIALTADFAANTIGGTVMGLAANRLVDGHTPTPAGAVNDIQLSGGTITGTHFAGTARAVDVLPGAGGITANISGLSGSFAGAFYGPGAAEAAGSLAMSGGVAGVIASFAAAK